MREQETVSHLVNCTPYCVCPGIGMSVRHSQSGTDTSGMMRAEQFPGIRCINQKARVHWIRCQVPVFSSGCLPGERYWEDNDKGPLRLKDVMRIGSHTLQ